ncbi:MAG: hydrogenase nickel incorporation protein HypB [Syntrophorhabdaceae bacterium PtaU1.Bin034]|nr:MAG: hydrogenase nickel incorporation protein HypB [Syntrophorhabdaceae bacterium PtaU1.Bin034]
MKTTIVAGPPSAGKTAVISNAIRVLQAEGLRPGAVKFDTRSSADPERYRERFGIPALGGLSGYLCPDHYFVSNLEEAMEWGESNGTDFLFIETAGLCLRCAPHVRGLPAVTVVDCLGGLDVPVKMGPMLSLADIIVLTKGDLVSQAERDVLRHRINRVNGGAAVLAVNGLTGTGTLPFLRRLREWDYTDMAADQVLRHDMPAAICSYCTGEQRIGRMYQSGNVEKLSWRT